MRSIGQLSEFIMFLLVFSLTGSNVRSAEQGKVLHAVLESSRTYMDYTRKAKSEFWISKDKMNRTRGNMILIVRGDKKLKWSVNLAQKTYYEFPDQKEKREKVRKGLYTYGINYEPKFEWKESQRDTQTVNGYHCRLVRLNGEADFAWTNIVLWICDDQTYQNAGKLNDLLLNSLSNKDEMVKVVEILKRFSHPLLVKLEEVCENAIAPTMSVTLTISEAGETIAPPGIFDLPKGLTKSVN